MRKIVIASGYFDPLHIGHLRYLEAARGLGDELWVIVNNDVQATLKKGKAFMRAVERGQILGALACVDKVRVSFDTGRDILQTLEWLTCGQDHCFIFAKGGDSTPDNTPETEFCRTTGIETRFHVGGGKIQSSSWLLNDSSGK